MLNEAPSSTISGKDTGLLNPFGIALDSSRNIYVADDGNSAAMPAVPASVFVYSAGSHGDAAPLATISGGNTGLMEPCGVALDSTGNIYVADFSAASVFVYPPLQTSGTGTLNENPTVTIKDSQHLSGPCGITLDSSSNIYVADSSAASVFAYPAVGSSTGTINDSPMSTISGPLTELAEPLFVASASSRRLPRRRHRPPRLRPRPGLRPQPRPRLRSRLRPQPRLRLALPLKLRLPRRLRGRCQSVLRR